MFWPVSVVVFLALTGLTRALPPESEIELLEDLLLLERGGGIGGIGSGRGGGGGAGGDQRLQTTTTISKRDLEFNQYVPAYRLRGEPSCEELRAMWRLSKREARRATSTNNLPRSRPYNFGRIFAFAPNGHQRQFVYGEPRNFASHKSVSFSPIKGSFDRLRGMLGMGVGRPGSFQKVRALVASQRLPGENSKGKLDELRGIVLGNSKVGGSGAPEEEVESPTPLRSAEIYQPVRRTPAERYDLQSDSPDSKAGFIGPLMPGYGAPLPSDWRARTWRLQHSSCVDTVGVQCDSDAECECAGQYRCSNGRCKVLPIHPDLKDRLGIWYSGPLPSKDLGLDPASDDRWSPSI